MDLRFLIAPDGVRLGYVQAGLGPAFVRVPDWGYHVESWVTEGIPREFGAWAYGRRFVTGDARGVGASQRDVCDISLDVLVRDLTTIVDHAGLERFVLFGSFEGAVVAMTFAAMNPQRVSHLVLAASFACGRELGTSEAAEGLARLARTNWRLAAHAIAGITVDQEPTRRELAFARALHASLSGETAARYLELQDSIDIRDVLPGITTPTLVCHRRGDRLVPLDAGRSVASLIPRAQFVVSSVGRSLEGNPFEDHVLKFIGGSPPPSAVSGHATATILFADIVDSTGTTERLGDVAYRDRAQVLDQRLRAAIIECGGMPVRGRTLGDGVLALFGSAREAIAAAVRASAAGRDLDLALHLGVHAGDIIRDGDDVYGGAVNTAARVSSLTAPNEILVSATVRDLARTSAGVVFDDRGEYALKGVTEHVRVFRVLPSA